MVRHHTFFPQESAPHSVTVSIGVASLLGGDVSSSNALIEAADQALYQAKLQGKDRVVASQSTS
jgi:diguanylate cyclase (GGDEF)-like protein